MKTALTPASRFKPIFFAVLSAVEAYKSAIFAAGAGRYSGSGGYTECMDFSRCRPVPPADAARPHIECVEELEKVE